MINRPLLAKNQAAFTPTEATKTPPIHIKSISGDKVQYTPDNSIQNAIEAANSTSIEPTKKIENQSRNASFLMGLNNRLSKQEAKLNKLEDHFSQLSKRSIGYRELALTFLLAVLVFTSLGLVFTSPAAKQDLEFKILQQLDPTDHILNNREDVSFLSRFISNPGIKNWLNGTKKSDTPLANEYKWPLERPLKNTKMDYNTYKHGINLPAKLGDPVVAIAKGTVLFSGDNIADYGNLILIQHDNDVISVYGNNYSNYVKKGQTIKKGELLAAVGETNGNQPRLYFEIRYQGKAQDPFLYYQ